MFYSQGNPEKYLLSTFLPFFCKHVQDKTIQDFDFYASIYLHFHIDLSFFSILQKNSFLCSQNDGSFSIYFIRFFFIFLNDPIRSSILHFFSERNPFSKSISLFSKYLFVQRNNAHLYLELLKTQYRDESFHKEVQLPFLKQKYVYEEDSFQSVEILCLHIQRKKLLIQKTHVGYMTISSTLLIR